MVSYDKFMKHASKVTKSRVSQVRPILGGVCHFEDGSLAVTDSHRLYFATKAHDSLQQVVKNPTTGEVIVGNYPEIKRLLPLDGAEQFQVMLNVKDTLNALKAMLLVNKKGMAHLTVESHDLIMKTELAGFQVSYNAGGLLDRNREREVDAYLNVKYLYEAFEFFKDLDLTLVTLKFYDNNRPMIFGTDNVTALVLPIRMKEEVK